MSHLKHTSEVPKFRSSSNSSAPVFLILFCVDSMQKENNLPKEDIVSLMRHCCPRKINILRHSLFYLYPNSVNAYIDTVFAFEGINTELRKEADIIVIVIVCIFNKNKMFNKMTQRQAKPLPDRFIRRKN